METASVDNYLGMFHFERRRKSSVEGYEVQKELFCFVY